MAISRPARSCPWLQHEHHHPGVTCAEPRGAFYAYPNLGVVIGKDGIANTTQLAERLLADQRLAVVP